MGNSVSLFTRNKVRAEDAVLQIQNKFVEGVFHGKPPVCNLCINYIRGGGRIIGPVIAFQGTEGHLIFFFFPFSIIQKEVIPQGAKTGFSFWARKTFSGEGKGVSKFGEGKEDFCH